MPEDNACNGYVEWPPFQSSCQIYHTMMWYRHITSTSGEERREPRKQNGFGIEFLDTNLAFNWTKEILGFYLTMVYASLQL